MDRLTHKARYEAGYKLNKDVREWQAVDRLAAYENTGITPDEIMDGKILTDWIPVSEWLPECEKAVEVTVERHLPTKTIYLTCRAIYEDGTVWSQDSRFRWENFDNYKYDEERDDWLVPEGWFEAVSYAEEFEAIDDFVIAWREVGEPYKPE